MEGNTILTQTSPKELSELIAEGVRKQIEAFKNEILAKDANDELMTREQACEFLQINPSTIWSWSKRGKVTAYGISGNRRYYKRSELLEALKPLKK
jgi:hypothetical protein